MRLRLTLALCSAAAFLTFSATVCRAEDIVGAYRAIYERQLGLLDVETGSNRQTVVVWYGHQLQQLRAELKKNGDLDGLVAVVAEMERFQSKRMLPDDLTATNAALGGLYGTLSNRLEQVRAEGVKKHLALLQKYLNALTLKKRELVSAEKLDEAKAVNEEIKKMESLQATLEGRAAKPPDSEPAPGAESRAAPKVPAVTP